MGFTLVDIYTPPRPPRNDSKEAHMATRKGRTAAWWAVETSAGHGMSIKTYQMKSNDYFI